MLHKIIIVNCKTPFLKRVSDLAKPCRIVYYKRLIFNSTLKIVKVVVFGYTSILLFNGAFFLFSSATLGKGGYFGAHPFIKCLPE